MKALVAIAYYGTANESYVVQLIETYQAMSEIDVDVVVLTERHKDLPGGVEQVIGLPSRDPYSLPFAHKRLFSTRRDDYDLYIYSEDDTLITEENISAFQWATSVLPPDKIAGFMRKEEDPNGGTRCSSVHSHYHWRPDSAFRAGGESFARYTNDHGACFLLTRDQLHRAIDSGGFLLPARSGRYDMRVTAATDPYTGCGFERVVCISRLDDFLLPHLTNRYVGSLGRDLDDVVVQVRALEETLTGTRPTDRLLDPTTALEDCRWDKRFYDPAEPAVLDRLGDAPRRVLSLGTGSGELEAAMAERGHTVVGIPLDAVIGALAEKAGVTVTSPRLDDALASLDRTFDALVAVDVLHHFPDPVGVLRQLRSVLLPNASIIVTVPNLRRERLRVALARDNASVPSGRFDELGVHAVERSSLNRWLRSAGVTKLTGGLAGASSNTKPPLPPALRCSRLLASGELGPSQSARTTTSGRRSPRVSFGLPVYNGATYLEQSLRSLCEQDFEDLEIVVSDNASTDGTEEICRAFAAEDDRVVYLRQDENRGAAANYNETFYRSRGELFCWAAHDDVRHPAFLSACVEAFDASSDNVVLVHPRTHFIDHDGTPLRPDDDRLELHSERPHRRLARVLARVVMANAVFGLIRSSALEQTRLIDSFIASDYALLAELALLGELVEVPEVLMYRRLHEDSSREANHSDLDVARWFDTNATAPRATAKQRLLLEYARSVVQQPMSNADRAACLVTVPTVMGTRMARVKAGRWRQRILDNDRSPA